jgi:CheY-like chemotaxis protein
VLKSPMRQVFQNLIGNSLKYQFAGVKPIIDIRFDETEEFWRFKITDNGIGIAADYFEKIFVIFQRLHNKDEYSGTGIGLSLTKKIVENMGGTIWVESEKPMRSIQILLIEDNEGDITLTTEALADSKVVNNIKVIKDGEKAISFFTSDLSKEELPDLVLLDVNLPKRSGHEVLHFIKHHEKYKQIPVIMLTTSSAEGDILLSYQNYTNCYITKPIDVSDFISSISKIEEFWINIVSIPKP